MREGMTLPHPERDVHDHDQELIEKKENARGW